MESALQKTDSLNEYRERVKAAQEVKDSQERRLSSLEEQKVQLETTVADLERQRTVCISGIGSGSHSDADLTKIKRELNKAKDSLADTSEILLLTKEALKGAERNLAQAKIEASNQEKKAWGGAVAELYARHRDTLEGIWHEIFVATVLANKGQGIPTFPSVLNGFEIVRPSEAQTAEIVASLRKEFGLSE